MLIWTSIWHLILLLQDLVILSALIDSLCLCSLQDSEKYVEQLLMLFNRFSKLVKEAFSDDPRFLTARDKVGLNQTLNNNSISLTLKIL